MPNEIQFPQGKAIWQSLTMIFNASVLGFVALALSIPEVMALIPDNFKPWAVALVLVINLGLRYFKTGQPITRIV